MNKMGDDGMKRKVRSMGKACSAIVLALAATALLTGPVRAAEHYYVILFAAQGDPPVPRYSHTFATFIRAVGTSPASCAVETHTISWSPASMEIRLARFFPERGVNLDLAASLRWARSLGARVCRWGPFEIRQDLYDRAQAQIARLSTGAVEYKVVDLGLRPQRASNCVHAVSDIAADDGLLETGLDYGEEASYLVACHFRPWMIEPGQVHDWLWDRIGLSAAPIARCTWGRVPAQR
jgi:hypothetical protein